MGTSQISSSSDDGEDEGHASRLASVAIDSAAVVLNASSSAPSLRNGRGKLSSDQLVEAENQSKETSGLKLYQIRVSVCASALSIWFIPQNMSMKYLVCTCAAARPSLQASGQDSWGNICSTTTVGYWATYWVSWEWSWWSWEGCRYSTLQQGSSWHCDKETRHKFSFFVLNLET